MASIKVTMICEKCSITFQRSKYRVSNHPFCTQCKRYITYNEDLERKERVSSSTIKRKNTCLEKYGVDCVSKVKEISDKAKKTSLINNGYENYFNNPEAKKTLQELAHNKDSYNKRENTCLERYREKHHMKKKEIADKVSNTYFEKTGYKSPMHNPIVVKEMINKYGQIGSVRQYYYNNIHFDSSWELAYYIWLTDNKKQFIYHPKVTFEYIGDDKNSHVYIPDFLVEGTFYEIKGTQFFNKNNEPFNMYTQTFWWAKYYALQKNNVIILKQSDIKKYIEFVKINYGNNFLKECKIERIIKNKKASIV